MYRKPNFFIVGAAKSGTTSLYKYLSSHPEVYFSPIKEPNYFSTDIDPHAFNKTYRKYTPVIYNDPPPEYHRLPNYQVGFVRNKNYYNALFAGATTEKVLGEASTSYLYSEEAAKNIYAYNPEARIMIMLRNPIERAFSHYLMALKYGFTKLTFRNALESDQKKKNKGWGISELFIELGMYYNQLLRYYQVFPHSQIKVLLFDDFVSNTQTILRECENFLHIRACQCSIDKPKYNPAQIPKYKTLNNFVTHTGIKKVFNAIFPDKFSQFLKSKVYIDDKPSLSVADKKYLLTVYRAEIEKTSELIGKDLSGWLK